MKRWGLVSLALLLPAVAFTATGDILYVQVDRANLRSGPSTSSPIILTLGMGHRLLEFERRAGWVHVGADRTGGKDGWVHASLVGPVFRGGSTIAPENPSFQKFLRAFNALNERVRKQTGARFFTGAEDLGDAIIQVTATDEWLAGPKSARESNLRTIFEMWDAADNTGLPIAVYVVDGRGNRQMSMTRR